MSQMGRFISLSAAAETFTGNIGGAVGPTAGNINLVGTGGITVTGNPGTSTLTLSGGLSTFQTDAGVVTPVAGTTDVFGGSNINTAAGGAGSAIVINLNNSPAIVGTLSMNNTNGAGTVGIINWGGNRWINNYGTGNTFVGQTSGNLTLTTASALSNTGIGQLVLSELTTGGNNTGIGNSSLLSITTGNGNSALGAATLGQVTTGSDNTTVGFSSFLNLITGSNNIGVGVSAGNNYTGAESSNILIGNRGIVAESNVIRIGTQGGGAGQQNVANIAGIYGSAVGATNSVVFIDNTGTLGTTGGSGSAFLSSIITDVGGPVVPAAGAISFIAGSNISTNGATANTVHVNLVNSPSVSGSVTAGTGFTATTGNVAVTAGNLLLPNTNGAGTQGEIQFNAVRWVSNYGTANTFVGSLTGNTTLTTASAVSNTGIGHLALNALTTGSYNTAVGDSNLQGVTSGAHNTGIGYNVMPLVTSGGSNVGVGYNALDFLITGSTNIGIGFNAGSQYTGAESNNIAIGNVGVTAESAIIRIGTTGTHTNTYIAGVAGVTVSNLNFVTIDTTTGKLGSQAGGGGGGAVSSVTGTANQVTASPTTGAVTLTLPATLIAPGSVEVTSGFTVDAGAITLTPLTTAGIVTTTSGGLIGSVAVVPIANGGTNASSMTNADGVVYYDGTRLVTTAVGTSGQVLTSNGAGMAPTYQNSVTGVTSIAGTANQITASASTGAVTLSIPSTFIAPGSIAATTTVTAGTNLISTAGKLSLPTTSTTTVGTITFGGATTFIHQWDQSGGGTNTWMGSAAGYINATNTGTNNTAIGFQALGNTSMTSASNNTALGSGAAGTITTGSNNVAVGTTALYQVTTGSSNIALGVLAGGNYTTLESSNIVIGNAGTALETHTTRIGTQGTGAGQQNKCFVAGINGVTASSPNIVTINSSTGQLGALATLTIALGGTNATSFTTDGVVYFDGTSLNSTAVGTAGQVLTSNGSGMAPTFQAGGGGGVTSISGTTNQITASAATGAVTLSIPSTFIAPGSITSTTSLTSGTNLLLPTTSSTAGQIQINSVKYFHAYGTNNTFAGPNAGNFTLTGSDTAAFGENCLNALTSGIGNSGFGNSSLTSATSGGNNVALGRQALNNVTSGSTNIGIGFQAGTNLTTTSNNIAIGNAGNVADSGAIRIGTSGTHTSCYVAGVEGVSVSNLNYVTIDTSTGQMGSTSSTSNYAWSTITTSQIASTNIGYITNSSSLITLTLPSTFGAGATLRISGRGSGGWRIAQVAGQTIHHGSATTTAGTAGSLSSTNQYDAIELLCVVANTTFTVLSTMGNHTVV